MRKLIGSLVIAVVAVVGLASAASADVIYIGQLNYTDDGAGGGIFTVTNQTGVNSQPGFPVLTQLLFNADLTLTVDGADFTPGAGLTLSGDGISYETGSIAMPSLSATLKGTIAPLLINVDGIGMMNVLDLGKIFLAPDPFTGAPLTDGDFALIYINAEKVTAPEPITLSLLGLGLAGVAVRRRRQN